MPSDEAATIFVIFAPSASRIRSGDNLTSARHQLPRSNAPKITGIGSGFAYWFEIHMSKKWRKMLSRFLVFGAESVTKDSLVLDCWIGKTVLEVPTSPGSTKLGREQSQERDDYGKDESFGCLVVRINGCNCRRSQNFLG